MVITVEPEEIQRRQRELDRIVGVIGPMIEADGGELHIDSDVSVGKVHVELRGSCSTCAISDATLQDGVARILADRLDWLDNLTMGVTATDDETLVGIGGWVPKNKS